MTGVGGGVNTPSAENDDCRGAARPGGELELGGKLKDLMAAPKMLTESVAGSRAETPRGRDRLPGPPASQEAR